VKKERLRTGKTNSTAMLVNVLALLS